MCVCLCAWLEREREREREREKGAKGFIGLKKCKSVHMCEGESERETQCARKRLMQSCDPIDIGQFVQTAASVRSKYCLVRMWHKQHLVVNIVNLLFRIPINVIIIIGPSRIRN